MIRYLLVTLPIAGRSNRESFAAKWTMRRGYGSPEVAMLPSVVCSASGFGALRTDRFNGVGNLSDDWTDHPHFGLLIAEFMAKLPLWQLILGQLILGQQLKVHDHRSGRYECTDSISVPRED